MVIDRILYIVSDGQIQSRSPQYVCIQWTKSLCIPNYLILITDRHTKSRLEQYL